MNESTVEVHNLAANVDGVGCFSSLTLDHRY
jgi:hypothetical protein